MAAQRMRVTGLRGGEPLLSFVATWYCTSELEPDWEPRATGWRVTVAGDAPLDVEMRFAVPLETMGDWMPGYTANRAVNVVPFVCDAPPGHPHLGGTAPDHRHPAAGPSELRAMTASPRGRFRS